MLYIVITLLICLAGIIVFVIKNKKKVLLLLIPLVIVVAGILLEIGYYNNAIFVVSNVNSAGGLNLDVKAHRIVCTGTMTRFSSRTSERKLFEQIKKNKNYYYVKEQPHQICFVQNDQIYILNYCRKEKRFGRNHYVYELRTEVTHLELDEKENEVIEVPFVEKEGEERLVKVGQTLKQTYTEEEIDKWYQHFSNVRKEDHTWIMSMDGYEIEIVKDNERVYFEIDFNVDTSKIEQ